MIQYTDPASIRAEIARRAELARPSRGDDPTELDGDLGPPRHRVPGVTSAFLVRRRHRH